MEEKSIALYHRVMRRETFEIVAKNLFKLLVATQRDYPNRSRTLVIDIDGHRNEQGGFDHDMMELQKDFIMDFLAPYFIEIRLPLGVFKNTKQQVNDIPSEFQIYTAGKKDNEDELDNLYIESYKNTEFISEEGVYEYLQKVSAFLSKYNELDGYYYLIETEEYDKNQWIPMWRQYMNDLINELFNSFTRGNLITATAMTRALIECYVYLSILKKERNPKLLQDWYLCNMALKAKKSNDKVFEKKISSVAKKYCESNGVNYRDIYNRFKSDNSWLDTLINKKKDKRITFKDICEYLGEPNLYSDFQDTSSFVHAQDIISKMSPFTFYISSFNRLHMMMDYIFKSIQLFSLERDMIEEIEKLQDELNELGQNFI